ncbi:hypothetical protein [Spongiactinospora gelatinilytica]|uniref:hypothetical protein n=1 Tax=Spongiactinospora gelatinilytica TaxID=2666298 RepID=UPI001F15D66D|nr:hypothetical protein [Spongiactinospora gelatinilytica]
MVRCTCSSRSACPARPEVHKQVRRLAARAEERAVIAEFNAARDAEVPQCLPGLRQEPAGERAPSRLTYAEADLERFRTWLAKIAAIQEAALLPITETPPPRVVHRP